MMPAQSTTETSVLTHAPRRNIPENAILQLVTSLWAEAQIKPSLNRPWRPVGLSSSPLIPDVALTDGGEAASLTLRPTAPYVQGDSWYSFVLEAAETCHGHTTARRLSPIKKSKDLTGN
jgi:hypothetical protein